MSLTLVRLTIDQHSKLAWMSFKNHMIGISYSELLLIVVIALLVLKPGDWLQICQAIGRKYKHLQNFWQQLKRSYHND